MSEPPSEPPPRRVDLTAEEVEVPQLAQPEKEDLERPTVHDVHRQRIEGRREWTRMVLAAAVILPVPAVSILVWIALANKWAPPSDIKDLGLATLGAVTGLAGAVLGFYFAREISANA